MKVKIAQIQAHVYEEKGENLKELERNLERIKDENIDLVTLGEMFNCPYQTSAFRQPRLCGSPAPADCPQHPAR